MPKGALSAFTAFNSSAHQQIKANFPDLSLQDLMRKKAELWSKMSDKEKGPYVELSAKDHDRFEKEVLHLRTHGFFINKDGVKSTDLKKKVSLEERKKQAQLSQETKLKESQAKEKEAQSGVRTKALAFAKLDKQSKCGFDEFMKVKYVQLSKKIDGKNAKELYSKA